jgi:hypothetical protein
MSTSPVPTLLESFRAIALGEGLRNRKSNAYKERRRLWLADAVTAGFIEQFGVDVNKLDNWKKLCITIGIEGASEFTSITQCREVRCDLCTDHIAAYNVAVSEGEIHQPC